MDPIQNIYFMLRIEKSKIVETEKLISTNTGDVQKAYSTIQSIHVSTVNGLTTQLQQLLSTSMGSN
jgi:hypothetical protein